MQEENAVFHCRRAVRRNKLAAGEFVASDGHQDRPAHILSPIIVCCSKADTYAAAQALAWILDIYKTRRDQAPGGQTSG